MIPDLNAAEYRKRMLAYGFRPHGFMGYWSLPKPHGDVVVSDWNAGPRYRSKLAYMLRQLDRHTAELEAGAVKGARS